MWKTEVQPFPWDEDQRVELGSGCKLRLGILMVSVPQSGSLIGPVGRNRYGWQIFQFLDPRDGQWRYVVHMPDGRLLYSDSAGDIGHGTTSFGAQGAGAVLGGAGGFLVLGPIGLLIGGILGALVGNQLEHRHQP